MKCYTLIRSGRQDRYAVKNIQRLYLNMNMLHCMSRTGDLQILPGDGSWSREPAA